MKKELINKIKKEIQQIKTRYQAQYGAVIFDVKIKELGNNVILSGVTLIERQKKEAFLAVQEILKDIKIKNEIKVLGDLKEKLEIGWGIIEDSIVDMWSVFSNKKKLDEINRATQVIKGDIVRILAKKGNYYLVQTQDLAIGWMNKYQVSSIKYQVSKKKWLAGNKQLIKRGKVIKAGLTAKVRKKFIAFLENYLYVPYVWGGTTELGIDCSGLTQKFYWEIFGILLPRNSRDQAEYGENISLEKAEFGDLVFLREKTKKYAHIGIIIEKTSPHKIPFYGNFACSEIISQGKKPSDVLILNARRGKSGVVIQSAEEILKDYNLISIKRLINLK